MTARPPAQGGRKFSRRTVRDSSPRSGRKFSRRTRRDSIPRSGRTFSRHNTRWQASRRIYKRFTETNVCCHCGVDITDDDTLAKIEELNNSYHTVQSSCDIGCPKAICKLPKARESTRSARKRKRVQTKLNMKHRVTKYRKSNSGGRSPVVGAQVPSADLHGTCIDLGAMKSTGASYGRTRARRRNRRSELLVILGFFYTEL